MNKILIIDDEPHFIGGQIDILKEFGYEVRVIQNAEDALKALENDPLPSLIIMDIIMPMSEKDIGPENGTNTGVYLLEKIRGEYKISVPIIVLTVKGDQETVSRLNAIEYQSGQKPNVFLKPLLPSELLEHVQLLLTDKP